MDENENSKIVFEYENLTNFSEFLQQNYSFVK